MQKGGREVKRLVAILLLVGALCCVHRASAQYYTWGSDPVGLKWSTMRSRDVRVIYPDTAANIARHTLFYIRTVQPDISYGFTHGPMRIPFVIHPENFQSNGLVMYLPKRVEFLSSPAIDGYSMPWLKQLVAHEYRHAVQYNTLDRGVIRALSYLLGQQGSTIGLLCMPFWAMEGDAVMSETQMSSFGRGLQPSFTLAYRAMERVGDGRRNIDKWFCGSYRDYIPDHYELGYQLCSYACERYGPEVWNNVARYGSRNPYVFAITRVALGKYYDTNVSRLFRETFDDLRHHWDSLPAQDDSAQSLVRLPEGNHTTYRWPLPLGDTVVLALKEDFDRPARFVRVDTRTGEERTVCYVGSVSTRPALAGGRVWWTEYRRSKLFEQRVNSQLCYMNLADGRPRTFAGRRNVLYPTGAGDDALAWVEYNPDGRYTVVLRRGEREERFAMEGLTEIHGLAWDDLTRALYVLVTDDSGMWLGRIGAGGLEPLTRGAYITLSDLRAGGGRLWFGSIQSGRDEVHCFDLERGTEYRLSTSKYGSFEPMPAGGEVLMTTYDRLGYRLTRQAADSLACRVEPARLPLNLVNPPRRSWGVVNLDTVHFVYTDSLAAEPKFRTKRYPKFPNLVNVHSWMPAAFDPFEVADEKNISLNLGVTLVSQNLLSNTEGFFSYGWNRSEGSLFRLGVRYFGLGVRFDLDAAYGGNQMFYGLGGQRTPSPDKYYSVGLTATLPLYLQRGYHTRQFSVATGWNFSNGMVANVGNIRWDEETGSITNIEHIGFREGLHSLSFSVGYSDLTRLAHRDFVSPWGYTVSAGYTFNPSDRHFSDLLSGYVKLYTPGFLPHNSLTVAATYQTSVGGYKFPSGYAPLSYRSTRLVPRGFASADIVSNDYFAAAVDYQFPLCYPEGGIGSVLYFKRIRLNVGGDYAQFLTTEPWRYRAAPPEGEGQIYPGAATRRRIWSVGGDLIFDVNLFRMPASATSTVKLSCYRPSTGGVWITAALGLPF